MKLQKNRLKKFGRWLTAMFITLVAVKAPVYAFNPTGGADIKVSINASKSLLVSPTTYNFGVMNINTSSVSATSVLVTNDSGGLQESYSIAGTNAPSTAGGTTWTLSPSTGTIDHYVLGAQFSTGMPANDDSVWQTSISSITAGNCTQNQFGNTNLAESGSTVAPSATRNLWFRMITPILVTDPTQRNATITLAVQ